MSDILKEKEHEHLWEWANTRVAEFTCFLESVSELLPVQKKSYEEDGYEVLDYCVEESGRMCTVKLLIKPVKKIF